MHRVASNSYRTHATSWHEPGRAAILGGRWRLNVTPVNAALLLAALSQCARDTRTTELRRWSRTIDSPRSWQFIPPTALKRSKTDPGRNCCFLCNTLSTSADGTRATACQSNGNVSAPQVDRGIDHLLQQPPRHMLSDSVDSRATRDTSCPVPCTSCVRCFSWTNRYKHAHPQHPHRVKTEHIGCACVRVADHADYERGVWPGRPSQNPSLAKPGCSTGLMIQLQLAQRLAPWKASAAAGTLLATLVQSNN